MSKRKRRRGEELEERKEEEEVDEEEETFYTNCQIKNMNIKQGCTKFVKHAMKALIGFYILKCHIWL